MIIDGKAVAAGLLDQVAGEVRELQAQGVTPGLTVLLVGEDPASQVYVRNKALKAAAVGIDGRLEALPVGTSQQALLARVAELNADSAVHGILVQLPLPEHIDGVAVLRAIDPAKDVDGFHPWNSGLLGSGSDEGLVPCTPQGCLTLIKAHRGDDLAGEHAVILGRSNIVGRPMARLLLNESCTVTVAHSRTRNLQELCRAADILVAAVGRPEMVRGDWIKPGATVIDVGINRVEEADGVASRLVGDVAFAEAREIAGAITPVPGGVGPMTVACLMLNTVRAARAQTRT